MNIVKVNAEKKADFDVQFQKEAVLLESQVYGNQADIVHIYALSVKSAEVAVKANLAVTVKDEGRKVGFWQFTGGSGVFEPKAAYKFLKKQISDLIVGNADGEMLAKGDTWAQILTASLDAEKLKALGLEVVDSKAKTVQAEQADDKSKK